MIFDFFMRKIILLGKCMTKLTKIGRFRLINLITKFPLHPIFIAIYPVVFLYSHNIKEVYINSIFLPIFVILLITSLATIVLSYFLKNLHKASFLTSFLLVSFFSYGHVVSFFGGVKLEIMRVNIFNDYILLDFWIALTFIIIFFTLRSRKGFRNITPSINIISAFLVLFSVANIVISGLTTGSIIFSRSNLTEISNLQPKKDAESKNLPSVYYIILDRYADEEILKEDFNFDNTNFIDFLQKTGFYVARDSYTNYPKTFLSLAASLNMEYLDELSKNYKDKNEWSLMYEHIYNHKVLRYLNSKGYEVVHFGDWWEPTRINKYADKNINYYGTGVMDEFANKLIETTLIFPIIKQDPTWYDKVRNGHLFKFDGLAKISTTKGPKFIFAHVILPHEPYVFGANCEPVNKKVKLGTPEEKVAYINQLKCTNKKVKVLISQIINNSNPKPMIILQSDEGPFDEEFRGGVGGKIDWAKLSTKSLRSHLKILNAYYLPETENSNLYPTITPVNSFRLIFNRYFDANFETLPDKIFMIPSMDKPYIYIDVTNKLREK